MATAGPEGNEIRFEYYDYDAKTLLFEVVMDTGDLSTANKIDNVPIPNSEGMEFVQWDLFAINGREVITAGVSFTPESNCPLFLVQNIEANGNDVVKATARWKVPVGDYVILDCGGAPVIKFYVEGNEYVIMEGSTWLNAISTYPNDFGQFASATTAIKYLKNNRQILNSGLNDLIIKNYNYITDKGAIQEPT